MSDILMPKGPGMQGPKDAVMERLRRRITGYRKHHDDFGPRFEHTVNGLNDQQKQETLTLRQKFLESKPKKSAKKSDKNKQDGSGSTGNQKLQKRPCEDIDLGSGVNGGSESYEPPTKITVCGGINGNVSTNPATGAFKHHQGQSPSQVHPGELVGANSLPNSKPLTSSGLKPGSGSSAAKMTSPISDPRVIGVNGPSSNSSYSSTNNITMEFKQEPNSAFVDLDECAAALEKDAAENGSIMSGLIGMGDFDTLKDLISEISDNPDFMKDFDDFDDDHQSEKGMQGRSVSMNPTPNHLSTNPASCADSSNASYSGHSHSRTPPVAPVTPTTSSPRLSHVKMESELNSTGHDGGCGNRGLSHCAGPSPAAASTASPLASQLSSHHPSQTPPYSSGSAMFDSASPSGAQSQANPLTPNSNANYCPSSNTPTPHNPGVQGMTSKGTRIPYTSPGSLTLDSPAAQTLKQMAEQHKHKAQLGMNTFIPNPGSNPSPARSPYSSGDYNGGFSASGEFSGGSNMNVNSNNSSSSYSNVSVRNQSNSIPSVSSVSDNMTMTMPTIKQETNSLYSPTNFPPSMDINKRSNVTNHVHHPPPPSASQSQPHKISASNSTRLPNSAMIPQSQQQPPLYSSKSFPNSSGNQLGPIVNASVSTSHMANSSHLQQFMNRPPNSGLSAVPPNNYPPTSHSGYQGSANHSNVQMNQNQPISQPNPAAPMPVSSSGSQQMGINVDLKNTMGGSMPPQSYYYQNQGVSPLGQLHLQQQQQQQASQSQVSESATFMNTNTIQSNSGNIVTNGNNQGQTINFTQQHLRMSTGITPSAPGMNRMMVPGPGPPVQGSGVMTRMGMPPRMSTPSGTGPTMNDMGMGPRMEMQQRMMRQQQVRGQSIPPQQMMRPPGPGEMMTQQQMMASQGAMMNRFTSLASNPSAASGPGRPGPGGPSMISSGGPGQVSNPNMSNIRMQQSMYGPGHGMGPMCGTSNNLAMGGNISMNNMNMPMRRMPSFNPASGVGPNPPSNISVRPGGGSGIGQSMMVSSQSQQQSMGSSSEWMAMSDPNMRNYPGANIPQAPHQPMRPNTNPGGFHQGMGMQMTQQQQHSMGQMQRGDGSMCGVVVPVGSQPGLSANQMGNMGYSQQPQQQQQMPVGGNPGSYSQSSMTVNKLSQSQTTMCVSSNFTMKSGGGMAISNSTGSGGTMMCANSQSMNQMCNSMKPSSTDMTNQDFNFDLLENITSGDASSFNSDSDFLSSFDSNSNYHNILDSL